MSLPRWLARVNKRTFNPLEIRRGKRPVLVHVRRSTGRHYETPLDAHPIDGGFVLIPMYGPRTDWVRNVMAAGGGSLRVDGREVAVTRPRLVRKADVWEALPAGTKTPPTITDASELLRLDVAG